MVRSIFRCASLPIPSVGDSDLSCDMFSSKSGAFRVSFPSHKSAVTGLVVDFLNSTLVSTSLDGTVNFSSFSSVQPKLLGSLDLHSSITCLASVKESGLIAVRRSPHSEIRAPNSPTMITIQVACDDLVVQVIDIDTRRVVRRFAGHRHAITVTAFFSFSSIRSSSFSRFSRISLGVLMRDCSLLHLWTPLCGCGMCQVPCSSIGLLSHRQWCPSPSPLWEISLLPPTQARRESFFGISDCWKLKHQLDNES